MVSHDTFRVMGYIYATLCIVGSLLFIINSSHMVTVKERYSNPTQVGSRVVGVSIVVLIFSMISIIFEIMLIFGMIMRRPNFIRYHENFITLIYVLSLIGMFVGCIVSGILIGGEATGGAGEPLSALIFALTIVYMIGIISATLLFVLIKWIHQGMIKSILHDNLRLVMVKDDVL
ncbi:uncharacterized protein LOC131436656 [Malaya genurostris]|uniref:uncharacterized protein LOC131436656 n=1 Tax=Malaya genurostris TaxID=325434 RepID=UPI0026F3BE16|nr:uncharacterized protein LOC131436656 [Malaya genurostris]